jgi:16S rRNA (guanine527-N7)-methyltransferase
LTPETRGRLEAFAATLLRWNARINLISRNDEAVLWPRHIEDSLRLAELLPAGVERVVDLGSGGGFPGLVIAIATGKAVELIEEDARKCAFLREAARIAGAPATVHRARIQRAKVAPAPVVTARALAGLDALLGLATPFLAPGGVCLFPKGREAEAEIAAARRGWDFTIERHPGDRVSGGVILRLGGIVRRPS